MSLLYWRYRVTALVSRALPEKLAYWVGLRIADLFYFLNRKAREGVRANLSVIFEARGIVPAELALSGLTRKTFQYFGKYLVDFFRFANLTPQEVRRRISIEHGEYLADVAARGRGGILVTAHYGNWELAGAVLAALGYSVNAVVLTQRLEKINEMFQKQRERRGIHVIPDRASPFTLLRCLKRGEFVALLADRDFHGTGELVPFFGRPTPLPTGPARLAWLSRAPIVVGFLIREVDDTFRLRIFPPLWPEEADSPETLMSRVASYLETEIAERPYQWFMFEPFWLPAPQLGGQP